VIRRNRMAAAIIGLALACSTIAVANPALAVTCSGRGCDNRDPAQTGCSSGSTVADAVNTRQGRMELRWSPACRTNWVRITGFTGDTQRIDINVWQRSTGITVRYLADPSPGTHWGNMVYSPGCAKGTVTTTILHVSLQSSDC
jgi:hypothetical protein